MHGDDRGTRRLSIATALAAWFALTVAFAVPEYLLRRSIGQPAAWPRVILGVAPHFVIWGGFALALRAVVRRFPIAGPMLALRAATYIAGGFVFYALDGALSFVLLPRLLNDPQLTPDVLRALFIRGFYDDFLLYWTIVAALHLLRYQRRLVSEERARAELQQAFGRAQLDALKSQIQPHFLFNTLNSIAELLHEDAGAAEKMLTRLADLLRVTLALGDRQEITLREEIDILDLYLGIQQVRFSDSISIEVNIDPAAFDCTVPVLVLQPIVENAFRHGFSRRRRGSQLHVAAKRGAGLTLQVRDNGSGLDATFEEGIGLRNTRSRLRQLYGADARLTVAAATEGGVVITIELPCRSLTP